MLTPSEYSPRLIDEEVKRSLGAFGAVEVCGPRWSGKTWTCLAQANSDIRLDDINRQNIVREDPSLALTGDEPHLIDEWQEVPAVWDYVRREVDAGGKKRGRFLLTGSSTPHSSNIPTHSGAGRIARVRMRTLSLYEQGISTGEVSLEKLFKGNFSSTPSSTTLEDIAHAIVNGGWPGAIGMDHAGVRRIPRQYMNTIYDISAVREGLSSGTARRVFQSLARTVGTGASVKTLSDDVFRGNALETEKVQPYLDFFIHSYLIEELGGWDAPVRSRARLRTKPKRYFADTSLACAALGVDEERLLADFQLFGVLFENLCIHDVSVYLSASADLSDARMFYYRDDYGLEVDIVIELPDGRWGAFEVKLGESKAEEAVTNLIRLKNKVLANPAACGREPEFLAVLLGNTPFARRTKDGIYVIPISSLGV